MDHSKGTTGKIWISDFAALHCEENRNFLEKILRRRTDGISEGIAHEFDAVDLCRPRLPQKKRWQLCYRDRDPSKQAETRPSVSRSTRYGKGLLSSANV